MQRAIVVSKAIFQSYIKRAAQSGTVFVRIRDLDFVHMHDQCPSEEGYGGSLKYLLSLVWLEETSMCQPAVRITFHLSTNYCTLYTPVVDSSIQPLKALQNAQRCYNCYGTRRLATAQASDVIHHLSLQLAPILPQSSLSLRLPLHRHRSPAA